MISDPLHLLACCLSNDGAGALVIASEARAADCALVRSQGGPLAMHSTVILRRD